MESHDKMTEYIIRTNNKQAKTYIVKTVKNDKPVLLGLIYTDFLVTPQSRDIFSEEIINPANQKVIGRVKLYKDEKIISVNSKGVFGSELSSLSQDEVYNEFGKPISTNKISSQIILAKPEFKHLSDAQLTHVYEFDKKSILESIYCFEKGNDLSAVINARDDNFDSALVGLTLALAQRIENQDYLFEFKRKD